MAELCAQERTRAAGLKNAEAGRPELSIPAFVQLAQAGDLVERTVLGVIILSRL
jgi:hypothetical protein